MAAPETAWTGLKPAQSIGQACVICGANYLQVKTRSVPVGRSQDGQVFACTGDCATTAKNT